jgi:putative peptide zinc metalloprotease protein
MTDQHSMFSPLWHRVEKLKPRLRPQVRIDRHVIRGEVWYVASDPMSRRSQRLSRYAYAIMARMNGDRSLGQIWDDAAEQLKDDAPSQDQIIQLVSQLYLLDLVQVDAAADMREIAERSSSFERRTLWQRVQNPLYLRVPLFDPDRILDRSMHLVSPLLGRAGAVAWIVAVAWFAIEAAINWELLTSNIADRVLGLDNLLILLVLFPFVKIVHELGHAYAVKLYGGSVHEVGIMLLVLMPAPYIDASASAVFASKWQRAFVGAAGMMSELALAASAMAIWLVAEPGLIRAIAFNAIVIASISTLIFNGNPLLRFDGYYILSDLIEIPNLASRANAYWIFLAQKHLFGMRGARDPSTARGEATWFLLYGPASFIYRLFVLLGVSLFVGSRYFFFGAALAIWTCALSIVWPLMKGLNFVLVAPTLKGRRLRALGTVAAACAGIGLLLFTVPVPHGTVARGIVWAPDEARVVAETNGQFVRLISPSDVEVESGAALIELIDPYVNAQRSRLAARIAELEARLTQAEAATPYDTQIIQRQLDFARKEAEEANRKAAALIIRSRSSGHFVVQRAADLEGLEAKKGQQFGFVLPDRHSIVRAIVPESDVDLVRTITLRVTVSLDGSPWEVVRNLSISRAVPGASHKLPSPALAQTAGGPFALDPAAKEKDTSLTAFFEFDIELPFRLAGDRLGERAWVRFDHGSPPIAQWLVRMLRQTFLRHFNV